MAIDWTAYKQFPNESGDYLLCMDDDNVIPCEYLAIDKSFDEETLFEAGYKEENIDFYSTLDLPEGR